MRKSFGDQVKALRLATGVSQEVFADMVGFARSYQSRIERGRANPSLDAIEALADALGVAAKTFFETPAKVPPVKVATPISVPFAADGTCFNPSLRRKRTGKFTVGAKGHLVAIDNFEDALEYLKAMKAAYWLRPNAAGDWGVVSADHWGALPKKYLGS